MQNNLLEGQHNPNEVMAKDIEMRTQLISEAYERAAAYTNLIVLAGYAGTFTLWSFTADFLPERAEIITALMLGISLFVFCGWEVYKMFITQYGLVNTANTLDIISTPAEYFENVEKAKIKAANDQITLLRYWRIVLLITIPLGFGSALLMFYNFLANLLNFPYWPS